VGPTDTGSKSDTVSQGMKQAKIEQRLRSLIELALAIGTREGLLGRGAADNGTVSSDEVISGGENVTDKGSI